MDFSFIIPAKNEESTLNLCINSILSQDYRSGTVEIIVIDDYSTDDTAEMAKRLGAIVLIPNMPSGKTSRAQNKNMAFQYSNGDYLIFLDAHIILPTIDWLSKLVVVIENTCSPHLFLSSFPALPPPELTLLLNLFSLEEVRLISFSVTCTRGSNQFVGGSMVVSKEAFKKLGGFPIVPASEDIGLYKNSISHKIDYIFVSELWVWHLDKKLKSVKNWIKRNMKEGYSSTAYSWRYSDKIGKVYSFLLAFSFLVGFLIHTFWVAFFLLLSGILFLQSIRSIRGMRLSNDNMTLPHLVTLISILFTQAIIVRISAVAGMFTYIFIKFKNYWLNWIRKRK